MANDPHGHPRFKPSISGGESFVMDNDSFDNGGRISTGKGDGYHQSNGFTISDESAFRCSIATSTGFDDDECTQDQQEMVDRGYMQAPNDWKNVEFTGVFRVIDSAGDHITIGFRGGRHTGSGGSRGCTGCNYKVSVEMNGSGIEIRKESWHVSYHDMESTNISGWESTDGDFGLKILCYNTDDDNSVRIQVYLDKNNTNDYELVLDDTDRGNVNSDAGECDCDNDGQPLVWGSPIVLVRGDEGEYGFKDITIYEIDPFGTGGGDDGDGGSGGGGSSTGYSVSTVTASSDDGHGPNNTRDGSFSTRWSAYNESGGQWIKFDLGSSKPVDEVKIAWYQGDERTNEFNIHTSTDGNSWTQQVDDTSSGNTTGFESYTFSSVSARYVRITGHGNSNNEWVSISEVEIHGTNSDPSGGGGGGDDDDGGGGTPPPEVTADFNILETIFAVDYNSIGLCNPAGTE